MEENNGHERGHDHLPQYELGHSKAALHPEPNDVDGIDDMGHLQLAHTVRSFFETTPSTCCVVWRQPLVARVMH